MSKTEQHDNEEMPELTPEEMKAIGEIRLGPSKHEQFLNAHYKKLIVGLLSVMLLAAGGIIYYTYTARQQQDAASALLDAVHSGRPEQLKAICTNYPGTTASSTAELLFGIQLMEEGQEADGIKVLNRVIADAKEDLLRLRAQVYLAGYYSRTDRADRAAPIWEQVAAAGNSPYLSFSLLSLGDTALQKGDIDRARSYYERLRKEGISMGDPFVNMADLRILLLGVDDPEPETPAPKPPTDEENSTSAPPPTGTAAEPLQQPQVAD